MQKSYSKFVLVIKTLSIDRFPKYLRDNYDKLRSRYDHNIFPVLQQMDILPEKVLSDVRFHTFKPQIESMSRGYECKLGV